MWRRTYSVSEDPQWDFYECSTSIKLSTCHCLFSTTISVTHVTLQWNFVRVIKVYIFFCILFDVKYLIIVLRNIVWMFNNSIRIYNLKSIFTLNNRKFCLVTSVVITTKESVVGVLLVENSRYSNCFLSFIEVPSQILHHYLYNSTGKVSDISFQFKVQW